MPPEDRMKRLERLKKIRAMKFLAAGPDATAVGSEDQPEGGPAFPFVPNEPLMNRLRGLGNLPQNFVELVSNAAAAAASPVETVKGLAHAAQQLPYDAFRRGFAKFTGEELPTFANLPGIPKDTPDVGRAILDDFAARYGSLEAIDRSSTERPAELLADLAGLATPIVGRASGISRINPLDAARRAGGAVARTGARAGRGAANVGEKAIVGSAEVLTGTQEAPAAAFRIGEEAARRPGRAAAFTRAQKAGADAIEGIRNTATTTLKEVFDDAKTRFRRESDRLFREKRSQPMQSPFRLAKRLDDVKASIIENVQRFRVNPRGRRRLREEIGQGEARRAPRDVSIDPETGLPETMPPRGTTSKAPRSIQEESGVEVIDSASGLPLEAKSGLRRFLERYRRTQTRPGSARSQDLSGALDLDFDNSTIGSGAERAVIKNIMNEVLGQETATLQDLNSLLQRIDSIVDEASIADPGLRSNAFVVQLRKELRDVLSEVPGYDDVAKIYEEAREFNHDFAKTFSLDAPTAEGALNKFEDALGNKASKQHRVKLLEKLALKNPKAENLAAEIAGVNLSELFGKGLIGRSVGTAILTGVPATAAGLSVSGLNMQALAVAMGGLMSFAVSSPQVMGRFLKTAGATKTQVSNLTKIAGDILKAADTKGIATQGLTWGQLVERLAGDAEPETPVPVGVSITDDDVPDFSGLRRR